MRPHVKRCFRLSSRISNVIRNFHIPENSTIYRFIWSVYTCAVVVPFNFISKHTIFQNEDTLMNRHLGHYRRPVVFYWLAPGCRCSVAAVYYDARTRILFRKRGQNIFSLYYFFVFHFIQYVFYYFPVPPLLFLFLIFTRERRGRVGTSTKRHTNQITQLGKKRDPYSRRRNWCARRAS